MEKLKIIIVSTGGTISSKYNNNQGYSPVEITEELSQYIKKVNSIADVEFIHYGNVLSFALKPNTILELINHLLVKINRDDYAGAVIMQGTASMEETSYLADLLWDTDKPLIFTGAMLNASETDWDGGRNIFNSALVALDPMAKNKGVLVCMGGEIHAARDVIKIHKTSLNTFVSLNNGPLGLVNNNRVIFYRIPSIRKVFTSINRLETHIEIIKVCLGTDSRLIDFLISNKYKGVILEGFPGGGGVTPEIMNSVKSAHDEETVFVLTPRSLMGSSISRASGGCGPWDLRQCGVINGGDLTSVKARILLMVALSQTNNKYELERIFSEVAP